MRIAICIVVLGAFAPGVYEQDEYAVLGLIILLVLLSVLPRRRPKIQASPLRRLGEALNNRQTATRWRRME